MCWNQTCVVLQFRFEEVNAGDETVKDDHQPPHYDGPSGLKAGVATKFNNPLECLAYCGGLDYDFVSRLAKNSNEYATGIKPYRTCWRLGICPTSQPIWICLQPPC